MAAVVDELARLGVELAVCLGDMVQGGDEPREVLERLAVLGCPVILGNADDFLLEVQTDSPEEITEAQLAKREWTLTRLDATHFEQIRSFPRTPFDRRTARVSRLAAVLRPCFAAADRKRFLVARRQIRGPRWWPHAPAMDAGGRRGAYVN